LRFTGHGIPDDTGRGLRTHFSADFSLYSFVPSEQKPSEQKQNLERG
jgi:hypothetical protein